MSADRPLEVELAKIAKCNPGIPITYIDDVDGPREEGDWVRLHLICKGERVGAVVLRSENFYAALHKVCETMMPGAVDGLVN